MKAKQVLIFSFIIIIFSCNNHKSKNTLPDKNEIAANNLALKYNAVTNWDSAYQYSINYQVTFIQDSSLMLFKGRIYDIIKVDSNYVVKVLDEREDSPQNFLAVITFPEEQFDKFFDANTSDRGAFVLKVSKITLSNPSIKMYEGSDGEGDTYSYSYLSDDKDQKLSIFYGKLVDFHLNEIGKEK